MIIVRRSRSFLILRLSILLLTFASCLYAEDKKDAVAPVIFKNVCSTCHGEHGEGKLEVKAPSIASLPAWYVQRQLENFQADRRGSHPQDAEGQVMRAIAKTLTAEQIHAMAQHVEELPRTKPAITIKTDPTRGSELFQDRCMECHRFNGEGEIVFGSAPLVGLPDWYIAAQLRKFKTGVRGAAKDDANGLKMVHVTTSFIEDDELAQSVAAWLMKLRERK